MISLNSNVNIEELIKFLNPIKILEERLKEENFNYDNDLFFEFIEEEKRVDFINKLSRNLEVFLIRSIMLSLEIYFVSDEKYKLREPWNKNTKNVYMSKWDIEKQKILEDLKKIKNYWKNTFEKEGENYNLKTYFDNLNKVTSSFHKLPITLEKITEKNFESVQKKCFEIFNSTGSFLLNFLNEKEIMQNSDLIVKECLGFVHLLFEGEIDKFVECLKTFLLNSTSFHDLTQEKDYHNLMGGIFFSFSNLYKLSSNRETGLGRVDHIIIPNEKTKHFLTWFKDKAFIIEYKFEKNKTEQELEKNAITGIEQINNMKYSSELINYPEIKDIYKICLAFSGKLIHCRWEIENNNNNKSNKKISTKTQVKNKSALKNKNTEKIVRTTVPNNLFDLSTSTDNYATLLITTAPFFLGIITSFFLVKMKDKIKKKSSKNK